MVEPRKSGERVDERRGERRGDRYGGRREERHGERREARQPTIRMQTVTLTTEVPAIIPQEARLKEPDRDYYDDELRKLRKEVRKTKQKLVELRAICRQSVKMRREPMGSRRFQLRSFSRNWRR